MQIREDKGLREYIRKEIEQRDNKSIFNRLRREGGLLIDTWLVSLIVEYYYNESKPITRLGDNYSLYLDRVIKVKESNRNQYKHKLSEYMRVSGSGLLETALPTWESLLETITMPYLQVGYDYQNDKLYTTNKFERVFKDFNINYDETRTEHQAYHIILGMEFVSLYQTYIPKKIKFSSSKYVYNMYINTDERFYGKRSDPEGYSSRIGIFSSTINPIPFKKFFLPYFYVSEGKDPASQEFFYYRNKGFLEEDWDEYCEDEKNHKHLHGSEHLQTITLLNKGSKNFQKSKRLIFNYKLLPPLILRDYYDNVKNGLLNYNIKEDRLRKIQPLLDKHRYLDSLLSFLWRYGFSFNDILGFITRLSRDKESFVGFLENFMKDRKKQSTLFKGNFSAKDLYDTLFSYHWEEIKEKDRDLVNPVELDLFKYNKKVSELNSTYKLEVEGHLMKHCVGGYTSAIKNGSRIFSIESGGSYSTVEFRKNSNGMWMTKQHYGIRNSKPAEKNVEIVNELKRYLNLCTHCDKYEYQDKQVFGIECSYDDDERFMVIFDPRSKRNSCEVVVNRNGQHGWDDYCSIIDDEFIESLFYNPVNRELLDMFFINKGEESLVGRI